MISEEKHYEFITSQVRQRTADIRDAFRMYIQMISAVVGGSVWLSLQHEIATKAANFRLVSNGLVLLITALCGCMIIENIRSWYRYHVDLAKFGSRDRRDSVFISEASIYPATWIETVMLSFMAIAAVLFVAFNPFH